MRNKKTSGEDDFNEAVCGNLRDARKRIGLSVDEMAEKLGVVPSTVCRIEVGRSSITFHTLCTWSDITGVSIKDLRGKAPV